MSGFLAKGGGRQHCVWSAGWPSPAAATLGQVRAGYLGSGLPHLSCHRTRPSAPALPLPGGTGVGTSGALQALLETSPVTFLGLSQCQSHARGGACCSSGCSQVATRTGWGPESRKGKGFLAEVVAPRGQGWVLSIWRS